ncbi:MAG: acyltransferase [Cellvibrio sp.]|uniref:acyltransferase n=1 Tax=Cellvibrio sp. TaxID=1965322 RepID=UPI0027291BFD|nr:acyltransferase [Cellvibrio sp.]
MIRRIAHTIFNIRDNFNSLISRLQIRLQGGKIGQGVKIRGRIFVRNRGGNLIIGNNVTINSSRRVNPAGLADKFSLTVQKGAVFEIGEYSGASNCTIYCATEIRIGSHVMIGVDCRIYDWDFHPISHLDRRNSSQPNIKSAPVTIEDDVFIGAGSFVLKGVRISQGAIIGAGSVVVKNIPAFQLWGGNPARFIRDLNN